MDQLQNAGAFNPPDLTSLETVLDETIGWRMGRVFADLWDVEQFSSCQYCANVHARQHAKLAGPFTTSALYTGRRDALCERDAAIMDFAEALTATPPRADQSHIKALLKAGLDEVEIQDLIHSVAIFGWANRLMHPLGHSS